MLTALLADIHGNREALDACLADARRAGADRYVFLGDLVGYGPDPVWVVERVAEMVADGALAIQGNHDAAAANDSDTMTAVAHAAIVWTRKRLAASHRDFLRDLPLDLNEDDQLYVHASACAPQDWIYTLSPARGVPQLPRDGAAGDVLWPHPYSGAVQRKRRNAAAAARSGRRPVHATARAAPLDRCVGRGWAAARP